MTADRPTGRHPFIDAGLCAALGVVVAIVGDPQPLAVIVAGFAGITAAFIAIRHLDRGGPK